MSSRWPSACRVEFDLFFTIEAKAWHISPIYASIIWSSRSDQGGEAVEAIAISLSQDRVYSRISSLKNEGAECPTKHPELVQGLLTQEQVEINQG